MPYRRTGASTRHARLSRSGPSAGLLAALFAAAFMPLALSALEGAERETLPTASDIASIFGNTNAWSFTDRRGQPGRFSVQLTEGVPALTPDSSVLYAANTEPFENGIELVARVRFDTAMGAGLLKITAGTNSMQGVLSVLMTSVAGTDTVRVSVPGSDPRVPLAQRTYKARWIAGCKLGLPEDIRVCVEHQIASLPALREKWLSIRWQLREDGTRIYVDDRLLWESPVYTSGAFSLELSKAVALSSFRAEPLESEPAGFERIALAGYLNASELEGSSLDRKTLPGAELMVGDVPFKLPAPDKRGNNHIDLEPSWLQSGFLGGRDSPRDGVFGGRWEGAWSLNPARIQFAIPSGRYTAIHLLAASDTASNTVRHITAQFYIPGAGRPVQVRSATVQPFGEPAGAFPQVSAKLDNGRAGHLFLITIPVEPGDLASFGDKLELELTKDVRLYRAYPDPSYYSFHQAGLPSAVHVYAMTLERPTVSLDLRADNGLHIWTAPEKPSYTATLGCQRDVGRLVLTCKTTSHDGSERTTSKRVVKPRPGSEVPVPLELDIKTHGYHELVVTISDANRILRTEKRGLVLLHPDTRERGNWERGRGPLFGFWNWRGGHDTPSEEIALTVMGLAGAETHHGAFDERSSDAAKDVARQYRMKCYKAFRSGDHYITAAFATDLDKFGLETATSNFVAQLNQRFLPQDDLNRPVFLSFFPEPGIGMHTFGVPLSYDGLSETNDYVFTADEEAKYQLFLNGFVEGAKIVKERYPGVLCLMPHGDPGFPPPFLRRSTEVRRLLDGVTLDIPVFERLPEQQMHKVTLHRLYIGRGEFRKAGIPNPWLPMYEGPCLPTRPGSLTPDEHAALSVRDSLILLGYGVDFQTGGWSAFDAGSFWGEQHYGGGICEALPLATPKPSYAAYATMTRQLNRRNFDKWIETGSLSTYALQFRHYKDGSLVHVFWTLRGKREVSVAVPKDARVVMCNSMDNPTELSVADGRVAFTVGQAPCFVTGLIDTPAMMLGVPDHRDSRPARRAVLLGDPGDGTWSVSDVRQMDYENNSVEFIRRYPTRMTVKPVAVLEEMGETALAVHLETPERDNPVMPFYTTLVPKQPLTIPGKASHLGIWVNAASDWGRVVYALRDAQGERWISIGPKDTWNNDDIHSWSSFNFDGWRYLRFELPACSPFDLFREAGSPWWGHFGAGDGIPDLPLTLEQLIVERRTHAMYVNDVQPTSTNDVLLGSLFVEYEAPEDQTDQAVAQSRLRMPVPTDVPDLDNPIARLTATGVDPAVAITGIVVPLHEADGTRCTVEFTTATNAVFYEVLASPYRDGRGAVPVSRKVKTSGALARGFIPATDFYLFVTYTDRARNVSKPSKGFHINLTDTFSQK